MSASDGPFTRRSAIYRGVVDGRLKRERDGLPEWLDGNVDTRCLAASNGRAALADGSGSVWVKGQPSGGGSGQWNLAAEGLQGVTAVAVI